MTKNGGLLYKSIFWTDETKLSGINHLPEYSLYWSGFELKYPDDLNNLNWLPIYQLIDFVINSTESEFHQIINCIDFENAIDYYIFINLVQACDNYRKNIFYYRFDEGFPLSINPWDLDLTFANRNSMWTTNKSNELILSNYLYQRLYMSNVLDYRSKLKNRWDSVKQILDFNKIYTILEENKSLITNSNAVLRNNNKWNLNYDIISEIDNLKLWLENRIIFLDNYFNDNY